MAHIAGLIAGKAHKNPFDYGFDVVTTTTHKTLRGPRGGMILSNSDDVAKKIDKSIFPGLQGGPLMHQIAAKAVAFNEALHPSFEVYAHQVIKNAASMADVFAKNGIRMMGGGTSNHLILVDLRSFKVDGLDGHTGEAVLDEVGITLNKNMVADDTGTALKPSGIRFGTPAITTRKFKEAECTRIAEIMIDVLRDHTNASVKEAARKEIKEMAVGLPVPDSFV
jgi:glycine hydroxymethyltransferase